MPRRPLRSAALVAALSLCLAGGAARAGEEALAVGEYDAALVATLVARDVLREPRAFATLAVWQGASVAGGVATTAQAALAWCDLGGGCALRRPAVVALTASSDGSATAELSDEALGRVALVWSPVGELQRGAGKTSGVTTEAWRVEVEYRMTSAGVASPVASGGWEAQARGTAGPFVLEPLHETHQNALSARLMAGLVRLAWR